MIRINNKPVFYKMFFDKGIIYLNDLQFNVDNVRSYESFKQKGLNTNFLTWAALRSSVKNMKSKSSCNLLTVGIFDPLSIMQLKFLMHILFILTFYLFIDFLLYIFIIIISTLVNYF